MNKLRYIILWVILAAMTIALPVQASGLHAMASMANSLSSLTFDLACDDAACRIQNASLPSLNDSVIWLYQATPNATAGKLDGKISLEELDGSSRGYASYRSQGGSFALGMGGEGSLARFMAYGALTQTGAQPNGVVTYHADGSFIQ